MLSRDKNSLYFSLFWSLLLICLCNRSNEEFRELSWQQQGHLYGVPFYYVEYGIAQLGALQLWQTHRKDPEKALLDYSNAMELGNTKTLPDLFAAAELKLGFDEKHLNSLIQEVKIAMSEMR